MRRKIFQTIALLIAFPAIVLSYATPCPAASITARYENARQDYQRLLGTLPRIPERRPWLDCIATLESIIADDSKGVVTERCLYLIGQCYHHLLDRFGDQRYFNQALNAYQRLVRHYPASHLADDAQFLIGILYAEKDPMQAYLEFVKVTTFYPQGDMAEKARTRARQLEQRIAPTPAQANPGRTTGSGPATLEQVVYWSAQDYTRVVFYLSNSVAYQEHALPPLPKRKQPARIYLDLKNCRMSPKLDHQFDIMDGFLRDVRIGQYRPDLARAVLDIDSVETHKIFTLADPFRIIVDVRGKRRAGSVIANDTGPTNKLPSLARQLGLGVGRVVLDPGHGGHDKGAIGHNRTYEKDITLAIAKRLKKILEQQTSCEVILTRTDDRFISLEQRTAIANGKKADLFISIHTNANENRSVHGTETYFLNLSTDRESVRVAAYENATSAKKISDLEAILKDLLQNTKLNESARLAATVHRQVVRELTKKYQKVRDLGVKQAPFYVLLGAEMPSILIETAFISNSREEHLLKQKQFQNRIAQGIARGISNYVDVMKKTAQLGGGS